MHFPRTKQRNISSDIELATVRSQTRTLNKWSRRPIVEQIAIYNETTLHSDTPTVTITN